MRKDLAPVTTTILSQSSGIVIFSMLHTQSHIIISIYWPPGCTDHHFAEAMNLIKDKLDDLDTSPPNMVMVGDFNLPNIKWQTEFFYGG